MHFPYDAVKTEGFSIDKNGYEQLCVTSAAELACAAQQPCLKAKLAGGVSLSMRMFSPGTCAQ